MSFDLQVKLHPTVLFQIVDSFERRPDENRRIIGTLLGTFEKGCVEVTDCFRVPHAETSEELFINMDFASEMLDMYQQVSSSEGIVGWFATGSDVTDHSVLIHAFYTKHSKCPQPVHLTVDTLLVSGRLSWKAYVNNPLGVPGGTSGAMFAPVAVRVTPHQAELVGVNMLQHSKYSKNKVFQPSGDLSQLAETLDAVGDTIDAVVAYIDGVLSGECVSDVSVGRQLYSMIHSVPVVEQEQFEEMLNSNIKDVLMVSYLSQLTSVQLQLSEKLVHLKL